MTCPVLSKVLYNGQRDGSTLYICEVINIMYDWDVGDVLRRQS